MNQSKLSFEKPETSEEIGQTAKFEFFPWGLVMNMAETSGGNSESCCILLEHSEVGQLREFLRRHA